MKELILNKQDNVTLDDFMEIVNNEDNSLLVTITYNCSNVLMNVSIENALIIQTGEDEITINSYKETELVISSEAINSIVSDGFDAITNSIVYRITLNNGMVICVSCA